MYTAQIRIKRDGVQVYQESQAFARIQAAPWASDRDLALREIYSVDEAGRAFLLSNRCLVALVLT